MKPMTPMEAWADGLPLVIWPLGDVLHKELWFVVAGYSRLPKGDVFFRDTWADATFAGHSALLLDGHAEQVRPDRWRVSRARAEIRIMDEEPYVGLAELVRDFNRRHGGTQERFDQMAADTYGDGSGIAEVGDE